MAAATDGKINIDDFVEHAEVTDKSLPTVTILPYDKTQVSKFFDIKGAKHPEDLRITTVGSYSITEHKIADNLSKKIIEIMGTKDLTITDAMACNGGNTISFAKHFEHVNSFEINDTNFEVLKDNVEAYNEKLLDKIKFTKGNYLDYYLEEKQEVIFLDPPWGGKTYKNQWMTRLEISGKPLQDIVNNLIIKNRAELIILKVPRNFDFVNFLGYIKWAESIVEKVSYTDNYFPVYYFIYLRIVKK